MKRANINIGRRWLLFIAAIVIGRLFLTGDRGILALNSPHDEFWYVHNAYKWIWCCSYNEMSFMHLPIYSIWLAILRIFSIPLRLGIDVGWLIAIGYLSFAIYQLTRKTWLAALNFAFLAFHPYTIPIFDRALAETFLTVISAAVMGAGIELWNCRNTESGLRRRIAFIVFAVGFSLAYHTRKEGIVLAIPLILLAFWSVFDRKYWWSSVGKKRLVIPMLVAPLLATFALGTFVAGVNYIKYGIFARYELAAPGYQRMVSALNSIDVGRTPRQITVTQNVLAQAYTESPTFRELKPFMEGAPGQMWLAISYQNTGITGEFGNGWFYWALRDVAAHAGWHRDAKFADSKYAEAAEELEKAFGSGRLKKRSFSISSFLDPDFEKWIPQVPASIMDVSKLVVQPMHLGLPKENASAGQLKEYVTITGQRKLSASTGSIAGVHGWLKLPAESMVGLGKGDVTYSWARLAGTQRPDVPGAYAFSVSADTAPTELHVKTPDGTTGSVVLSALKEQTISYTSGAIQAELGIDSLSYSRTPRVDKWLPILCTIYEWIGYAFCLAAVGGVLAFMVRRDADSGLVMILVLLTTAIAARVTLFGILDASSWSGLQGRYILPIIPAFACMGALGIALLRMPWGRK